MVVVPAYFHVYGSSLNVAVVAGLAGFLGLIFELFRRRRSSVIEIMGVAMGIYWLTANALIFLGLLDSIIHDVGLAVLSVVLAIAVCESGVFANKDAEESSEGIDGES